MDHKLLEITDKLFKEGIEKAEKEKSEVLQNAEKEAKQIIEQAKEQAAEIINKANKESDEISSRVHANLKLATDNILVKLKQDITNMLELKVVQQPVKQALSDKDFTTSVIATIAKSIYADTDKQVMIRLNSADADAMQAVIRNALQNVLQQEPIFLKDETISSGFKIGTSGSNYIVSFTDADFNALVSKFFRAEITSLFHAE